MLKRSRSATVAQQSAQPMPVTAGWPLLGSLKKNWQTKAGFPTRVSRRLW